MTQATWETSSDLERRWLKRKAPTMGMPGWAGLAIVALGLALIGTLAWQGGKNVLNHLKGTPGSAYAATAGLAARVRARVPEWQTEAQDAFRDAVADSTMNSIDGAEMAVDRGAEIITEARARLSTAPPDFFDLAIRTLDQVVQSHPDNDRLVEHTVLARVELAQMRTMVPTPSASDVPPSGAPTAGDMREKIVADESLLPNVPVGESRTIQIYSPISIPANSTYDTTRAHGSIIDASRMASDAEILLPPASRINSDGVRVRDLTLQGAAQTLDGVYWENVTFIDTRLRYDGGEVSLHSVRFINCTFGMPPNERGSRLATAIALGQSSVVIE